jgi:Arc/MetJ-type ribon-helix-helix transcriptional regulator
LVKKRLSVTLTEPYLKALDRLVLEGVYLDRGEVIMEALRCLFRHYGIEPFVRPLEEKGE